MHDASDMELLRDYDRQGSEAAFAELVRRHINLVYSTALRHIGIAAHAEEITQAVFIILAHKAAGLRADTILEGWLHETTRLTALSFMRGERRRQFREQEAYMQSTLQENNDAATWNQLAPLLDEAVSRLGKKDRDAVMLRFFKDKSLREVAAALNVNEAAAQRRVHRAVEKLRGFFARRGVVLPAAALTTAISANSVQAAPVALAKSVTAVAIAKGAAASGSTLTLIKGALKIMAWTKVKTAIVVSAVILAAAGTATLTIKHMVQPPADSFVDFEKQLRQKPGGALTLDAVTFLTNLKRQGRLPGFPTNEHATTQMMIQNLYQDRNGVWQFNHADTDTYPASRTLHASKNNDGHFVYYYTVVKASETDVWQLKQAWLTDTNGQVMEKFPIL
jgi:RNA polymerase sigma factor (sigma-70 family)